MVTEIILDTESTNISNVCVSKLITSPPQSIAFIKYNKKQLLTVKTEPIRITSYGIPQLDKNGAHFYPMDKQRHFIKIPLDPDQNSCIKLKKLLQKMDEYFGSKQFRKILFGTKYFDKYQYQLSVRTKQAYPDSDDYDSDDDDSPPSKNKKIYPDYCKVVFMGDRNQMNISTILTRYNKNIPVRTVTDMEQYVKWGSTYTFCIHIYKIWANTSPVHGATKKLYGLGLKMKEIIISQPYIHFSHYIPECDLVGIKRVYKTYMDEKKNSIQKYLEIEI